MYKKIIILLLALFLVACSSGNKVTYTSVEDEYNVVVDLHYKNDNTVTKIVTRATAAYNEEEYQMMEFFVGMLNESSKGISTKATKKNDKMEFLITIELDKATADELMQYDADLFKDGVTLKLEDAEAYFKKMGYTKK